METIGKRGNRYDLAFKVQAVELLRASGKTRREVARDLGVSEFSLSRWEVQNASRLNEKIPESSLAEENRRLRQENRYLKRQGEILKKAIAICSKDAERTKGFEL